MEPTDTKTDNLDPTMRINTPIGKTDLFKEVLLYILEKVGNEPNVGRTVISKLLYFIDFDHYEIYEEQLMGLTYIKKEFGPIPTEFKAVTKEMEDNNELRVEDSQYGPHKQHRYTSLRQPNLAELGTQELEHIDRILEKYSGMSANEISDISHKDTPWIIAEAGQPLEYEAVFYRTSETAATAPDGH